MAFDEFGFDLGTPQTTAPTGSGFIGDFFEAARTRLSTVLQPVTQPTAGPSVGGQLFEAIYQYGAGKLDAAREKAVGAFLMTSEGQRVQAEGVRQTAQQYLPMIVIGALVLVGLGFAFRR
jgi:hypothetical protein